MLPRSPSPQSHQVEERVSAGHVVHVTVRLSVDPGSRRPHSLQQPRAGGHGIQSTGAKRPSGGIPAAATSEGPAAPSCRDIRHKKNKKKLFHVSRTIALLLEMSDVVWIQAGQNIKSLISARFL